MDQEKPLVVRTSPSRGVLRAEVSGSGSYANTLTYWEAIAAAVRTHASHALLLIDATTGAALPAHAWKALVDAMTGKGLENVRTAHVKPHGLQQIEYCELYAREAGFVARVFTDAKEAELWLRYGTAAGQVG